MPRPAAFLNSRAVMLGLASTVFIAAALVKGAPSERSLDGLTAMLSEATSSAVDRESIVWEPSPGIIAETFYGRRVLFLGPRSKRKGATCTVRASASRSMARRSRSPK